MKVASAESGIDRQHGSGGPQAGEEEQDHQAGEQQADQGFVRAVSGWPL